MSKVKHNDHEADKGSEAQGRPHCFGIAPDSVGQVRSEVNVAMKSILEPKLGTETVAALIRRNGQVRPMSRRHGRVWYPVRQVSAASFLHNAVEANQPLVGRFSVQLPFGVFRLGVGLPLPQPLGGRVVPRNDVRLHFVCFLKFADTDEVWLHLGWTCSTAEEYAAEP